MDYLAAWCALGLGSLASQDIFQRANAARSESIAVRSTFVGASLYLVFAMLPLLLGLMVFQLNPEIVADNTPACPDDDDRAIHTDVAPGTVLRGFNFSYFQHL